MPIEVEGRALSLSLPAPDGGARLSLHDGDQELWSGTVRGGLRLQLDAGEWGVPAPLLDLLSIRLPGLDSYSIDEFAPLATGFLSLATLRLDKVTGRGRWIGPSPVPGQMLPLNVMAGAIHYAQSVFEGCKVFFCRRGDGVQARMFRPRRNAARMWRSALQMGIPLDASEFDGAPMTAASFEELYLGMVRQAVHANLGGLFGGAFEPLDTASPDFKWNETPPSVYVRPVLFASGPVLGVKPAEHYTLGMYITPVGKYRADLVLRIERDHPRAFKGGTGAAKASCNYAPTLSMMKALKANKKHPPAGSTWTDIYDDILFVDSEGRIEEMGGANFFVMRQEGGSISLRSPRSWDEDRSADTILPGITRSSVLALGRLLGLDVRVEDIALTELLELPEDESRRTVVFTTGTAAGIAPVVALLGADRRTWRFAVWDSIDDPLRLRTLPADDAPVGSALDAAKRLRTVLFRVQLGDEAGLRRVAPDHADAILAYAESEGWLETFAVR
jgi:branched-chain amino acid aminotransferase